LSRIIGIDLGTTNSLVAYVDDATGLPRVIPDGEGRRLLPSVVAFTPEGIDPASIGTVRAIASKLSSHGTWVVTVGVRPKPNEDPAAVRKNAELVAAKLNAFARRPDAAAVGDWKDVRNAPRAEEFGIGFTVADRAAAKKP